MKSTSSVAKATPIKQTLPGPEAVFALPIDPAVDPVALLPTTSAQSALEASGVNDEIIKRGRDFYSFRHWGINE